MEDFPRFNPNMESLQKILARNMRKIRAHRGLSQPDLIIAGLKGGTAHRITEATGQNVKLKTLDKLATVLKLPAWQLLHPGFEPDTKLTVLSENELEDRVKSRVAAQVEELAGPFLEWRKMYGAPIEARSDGLSPAKPFLVSEAPKKQPRDRRIKSGKARGAKPEQKKT
jgi:transcriptional regulator with XRE-family HTH domain